MEISHILAPTDFWEYANQTVTAAFELAQTFGAKLTVLHVVEPPSYVVDNHASTQQGPLLLKAIEAQPKRELDQLFSPIPGAQVEIARRVLIGVPYQRMMETAATEPVTLIVMATHGRTGWARGAASLARPAEPCGT
jgi:nucleotide-binding universal stress UspA family protein